MASPASSQPPLYRRSPLRVLVVAALLLLLLECVLRLALPQDSRVLRDPMNPYGCYRDEELSQLVQARRQGGPRFDVVLLGDSVLSSVNNRPGEHVGDYLEPLLRQRIAGLPFADHVFVWDLGAAGSHAADLYAALRRILQRTQPQKDLLVVLNSNVIFFSRRHMSPPMLFPCLGEAVDQEARGLLKLPPPAPALERHLVSLFTSHVYLYQQRRRMAELLFGGPPREVLRERLVLLLGSLGLRPGPGPEASDANLPWSDRGLSAAQYAANYQFIPLSSHDAKNYRMTLLLARFLGERSDLVSFVFLTPQNHALLGSLLDSPSHHGLTQAIEGAFIERGVWFKSYDGLVGDDKFIDLDHLTAAGNQQLAKQLADDLAPRIRDVLKARDRP